MTPTSAAIIRAHEEWKGCRPDQCTRECPHLAPKKRPSQSLCLRYAEHLAAAAGESASKRLVESWADRVTVADVRKALGLKPIQKNSDAKEPGDADANG